jgi:hypothetical protein
MTTVTEIAPDVYRISTYESQYKQRSGGSVSVIASAMKEVLGKEG